MVRRIDTTYILLAAGKGTRLHPLTLHHPKSLYKLDKNTTVLERMVRLIRKHDRSSEIVVVTGFMSDLISSQLGREAILINNRGKIVICGTLQHGHPEHRQDDQQNHVHSCEFQKKPSQAGVLRA